MKFAMCFQEHHEQPLYGNKGKLNNLI